MWKLLIERVKAAIHDSEVAGPKHGVVMSQEDAKRLLLLAVQKADGICRCTNCRYNR